jgi:hypothetical protein
LTSRAWRKPARRKKRKPNRGRRFFYKPYYLEPQKGGDKAYALLRDALKDTNKVGVAKVVIKTRQYLAGVKPEDGALLLELMASGVGSPHVPPSQSSKARCDASVSAMSAGLTE